MNILDINLLGVLIAFAVSFISGAIWFGPKTMHPIWMKAKGFPTGELPSNYNKPVLLFGGTIIAILIQTLTLAAIISSLSVHSELGVAQGAVVGLALGVGISMFSSLSHRLFGGESLKVWLIETANDAINLTIAGAIIAFFQ